MPSKKYKEMEKNREDYLGSDKPKHKQFIKMLTFRVVPAYYQEIEKVAKSEGMITMRQDGYLKALSGLTTINEVNRVASLGEN